MTVKELIRANMTFCHDVLTDYYKDLSDAELLLRAVPGMNHIAWQLGHLIGSERWMISALGREMPELPAGFAEAYSKETAAIDDPKKFSTKQQYMDLWRTIRAGTLAAFDATPDADLDNPSPESMHTYAATVGAVFMLIGQHELMHAGQFVAVRRKLGKPAMY